MHESGKILTVGAVQYLNSRPLIDCLPDLLPDAEIFMDVPSRLADGLAAGRFDVALIPTIEAIRLPGVQIVSDACVSCDGPVRSVKMFGRVRPEQIQTLALDEGSRTSAALARILLKEKFRLEPQLEPLVIGEDFEKADTDAVVVIGDRAMVTPVDRYEFVWDLGEQWRRWTGLPFVFAMWTGRSGADFGRLGDALARARDRGLERIDRIAALASREMGIPESECLAYLRQAIRFHFGPPERAGLERFAELAIDHRLVPEDSTIDFAV